MSPTTQAATGDGAVSTNGAPSLSERVKGLHLGEQIGGPKGGRGSSWLPWTLCLLMAVTWTSFAIRAYTTGGFKAILAGGSSAGSTISPGEPGKSDRAP